MDVGDGGGVVTVLMAAKVLMVMQVTLVEVK